MIRTIIIKGFQSHEDTTVNLDKNLNVITGATDSGKTAIIRALRWLAFGEPAGDSFVNKAVGFAEVTIIMSGGNRVTKQRKGAKTNYEIEEGGKITAYEKAEVPVEVQEMLEIRETIFGDFTTALNFAFQLDTPFLLSEPGSAGAKVLGKLAEAEIVDKALKSASQETHALSRERKAVEKLQAEIVEQLKAFDKLEDIEARLLICEGLKERLEATAVHFEALEMLNNKHHEWQKKYDDTWAVIEVLTLPLAQAEKDLGQLKNTQQRSDTLLGMEVRHSSLTKRLGELGEILKHSQNIKTASVYLPRLRDCTFNFLQLKNLLESYQKNLENTNFYYKIGHKMSIVNECREPITRLRVIDEALSTLVNISSRRNRLISLCKEFGQIMTKNNGAMSAPTFFDALRLSQKRLSELELLNVRWYQAMNAERQLFNQSWRQLANRDAAYDELEACWKSLNKCPLCGQKIKEDCHGR